MLALSQVAKEAIFTSFLLAELGVTFPEATIQIQCNNQQTIWLVNEEISQLTTKLRHVDIHNHWLRQEVARGTIAVEYASSTEMIADGLTKALAGPQWKRFLDQLGVVSIKKQLKIQQGDLDQLIRKFDALEVQEGQENWKVVQEDMEMINSAQAKGRS